MNNLSGLNTRNRRTFYDVKANNISVSHYSTDAQNKVDMKNTYGDAMLLTNINNLHLIPDPLKKNLADSVITGDTKNMMENKMIRNEFQKVEAKQQPSQSKEYTTLTSITSYFNGFMNVLNTMFQKRPSSPVSQYYECFDKDDSREMAPSYWQTPKLEVLNKNEQSFICNNGSTTTNMDISDCKKAAMSCENKLNQVQLLLSHTPKFRQPKRVFVEANSIEDTFEDAFCPEDFVSLATDSIIECYGSFNNHNDYLFETDAPCIKTNIIKESLNIVTEPDIKLNDNCTTLNDSNTYELNSKHEVIASCEDKISKIKALLKSKCKTNDSKVIEKTNPILINNECNNTLFVNEMKVSSSNDTEYIGDDNSFDEINGRFHSSSTDSNDSFQIVFNDSRRRLPSDCESEDSFIVFDESPDSCYASNDVFCNDDSDTESEIEEDSGCIQTCKLDHTLSRTFGDLTDNSLYSTDVVDCSSKVCDVLDSVSLNACAKESEVHLDKTGKEKEKKQNVKKVRFSPCPPKVHVMRVWAFAARQARIGDWERLGRDRDRFKRRIADVDVAISWVLKPQHRSRVVFQRFRPWWNAQKRKELAEAERTARDETEKELVTANDKNEEMDTMKPEECVILECDGQDKELNDDEIKSYVDEDSVEKRNGEICFLKENRGARSEQNEENDVLKIECISNERNEDQNEQNEGNISKEERNFNETIKDQNKQIEENVLKEERNFNESNEDQKEQNDRNVSKEERNFNESNERDKSKETDINDILTKEIGSGIYEETDVMGVQVERKYVEVKDKASVNKANGTNNKKSTARELDPHAPLSADCGVSLIGVESPKDVHYS